MQEKMQKKVEIEILIRGAGTCIEHKIVLEEILERTYEEMPNARLGPRNRKIDGD